MTESLLEQLENHIKSTFESVGLSPELGRIVTANKPELGQFQCNGAFKGAKQQGINPLMFANCIADKLKDVSLLSSVTVSEPGFLNFEIRDDVLSNAANNMLRDERLGVPLKSKKERIVLDFGGMNIAKAMHVGHLRSSIIGESLRRLCEFLGDEVIGDIHLGDWGLPMGMLIEEFKHYHPNWAYFKNDFNKDPYIDPPITVDELEKMYPQAALRCKELQAREAARRATALLQQGHLGYLSLWRWFRMVSLEDIKKLLKFLDINIDLWYGESTVHSFIMPMIEKLKNEGVVVLSEGALVISVEKPTDKKPTPPLILLTSDQTITYAASDLATIYQRQKEFHPNHILYVVDKRQSLHFEQLFRAAEKCKINQEILEHIGFGTINGKDGKPFKTREGGVMKLSELLDLTMLKAKERLKEAKLAINFNDEEKEMSAKYVAVAAIKFADLSNPRLSDYIFDVDKFVNFHGRTGPYLLYTAVRIKSLLKKAKDQGLMPTEVTVINHNERDIIFKLVQLPQVLQNAYFERCPHHMCAFAYALAHSFSVFYENCRILQNKDKVQAQEWLGLSQLTLNCLTQLLYLLGIAVPERM